MPQERQEVFRAFNDTLYTGHFGVSKTRRMDGTVILPERYVKMCEDCTKCHSCLDRRTPKGHKASTN